MFLVAPVLKGQIQFKVFDSESGLSTNFAKTIAQDKTGYLWVGTTNGLNRFDGYSFKVFKHNPKDDNSITDNEINALAVDRLNRIWIGGASGVTCYDQKKNRFTRYKLMDGDTSAHITFIDIERENLIWIGTTTHGLILLDPQTEHVKKINLSPYINKGYNPKDFINYNTVFGIHKGKESIYWLATADGLYQYNITGDRLTPMRLVRDGPGTIRDDYFLKIVDDKNGGFWLCSYQGGVSHYNPVEHSFNMYKYKYDALPADGENIVTDFTWKNKNEFWIAVLNKGLGVFNIHTKSFTFFESSDVLDENNVIQTIGGLFLDRGGALWGCSPNGLVMVDSRKNSCVFNPIFGSKPQKPILDTRDLIKDSKTKKKFFATGLGPGLVVSNENETEWRSFECRKNPLYENYNLVQDLLDEGGDYLWVVSRDNVRLFDKVKEHWVDLPQLQKMESSVSPSFTKILKDSNGDYWIGSYRNGSYHLRKSDLDFTNFKRDPQIDNSIGSNNAIDLLEDKLGRIWIASNDRGISVFNPDNNRFQRLSNDRKADWTTLPTNSVSGLTQDQAGSIWISSPSAGVMKATIVSKDSLTIETFDNDLLSSPTFGIMADNKDRIWFWGFQTVNVLDPQTMHIKSFRKKNGLASYDFHFMKYDGSVLIGAENGYYTINEADLKPDTTSMPLVINSFRVFGKEIFPREIKDRRHYNLSYNRNSFTIDFAAINLTETKNIRYSYKLEGADNSVWSAPSDNRSTELAGLAGGDYVFKLKASNQDGIWGVEKSLLYIHIGTPFWKTKWFYATVSISGIALLFLLYNFQITRIRKKAKEKNEINERISQLQLKALYAQMSPHFIFNCLSAINGYIITSETIKASEFLTKFSKLMRAILENSSESWITLEKEIDTLRLYLNMEELRFEDKFSYQIEVEDGIPTESLLIPSMIFQPYVENAIWHGLLHKEQGIGIVSLKFSQKENNLICVIEDNGVGREKSGQIKNRSQTRGKSFGLRIASERLQLLHENSTAEIQDLNDASGQSAGTRVIITLITKKNENNDKIHFNR